MSLTIFTKKQKNNDDDSDRYNHNISLSEWCAWLLNLGLTKVLTEKA